MTATIAPGAELVSGRGDPSVAPEDREPEDLAGALDAALAAVGELDVASRRVAGQLQRALDDAHRAALVHLIRALRNDPRGKELLFAAVDIPAVRMVLLMHELIRPDPTTLARQALDEVRPQLQSHGGDVTLDRVADGVEVVPNEPGPALIPLGEVGLRSGAAADPTWCAALTVDQLDNRTVAHVLLHPTGEEDVPVIVVNLDGQLAAYRDACAHLSMSLAEAELDPVTGELTCPWHGHTFDGLSGESRSLPGAQLDPLPLRVDGGQVWVRARS